MTPRQFDKAVYSILKVANKLEAVGESDPEVLALGKTLKDFWMKAYRVQQFRELASAARKDKGVVLWTVFQPERKIRRLCVITRTPNRVLRAMRWDNGPWSHSEALPMCSPYYDFRRAMEGQAV